MGASSLGVTFSAPYEIASVRPLRQKTISERLEALRAAHLNTDLIPQDLIYIDLSTDSGVSSLSTNQLAALSGAKFVEPGMGLAVEGSLVFARLAGEAERIFGFPFLVPTTQGRTAERIWTKINVRPGSFVCGNMLFPSTRNHIEMNGAKLVDVVCDSAHDLTSHEAFKGNVDLTKLGAVIAGHGAAKISCVYVELALNACGGHRCPLPISRKCGQSPRRTKFRFFWMHVVFSKIVSLSKRENPVASNGPSWKSFGKLARWRTASR